MTREELENRTAGLLGGRAAERLVFKRLSTGAANDLDKATDIARNMVMRYGMDETLGQEEQLLFLGGMNIPRPQTRTYCKKTASQITPSNGRLRY